MGDVQFTKASDTLYKHMGYTSQEAFDTQKKNKKVWERKQTLIKDKKDGKYKTKQATDTFIMEVNYGDIEVKDSCFSPAKTRFFLYNKVSESNSKKNALLENNVIDCFFQSKLDYDEDIQCQEEVAICSEESGCVNQQVSLFEIFFGNTDEDVNICTPME